MDYQKTGDGLGLITDLSPLDQYWFRFQQTEDL